MKSLSRVRLFTTPWTVAYQAPLSMGFSRQEYWSGVPLPSLEWGRGRTELNGTEEELGLHGKINIVTDRTDQELTV